ncbi:Maestro heat-like repeat-containing protein family member 7, partial [Pterocles gutturalis]
FGKYLQPFERTGIILTAIEAMTDTSIYKEVASSVLDEAMKDPDSWLTDVPKIVDGIRGSLERVHLASARHSMESLILLLTNQCPREVVRSLLKHLPSPNSAALAMLDVMFSLPQLLEKVLRDLQGDIRGELFSISEDTAWIAPLSLLASNGSQTEDFVTLFKGWRSLWPPCPEILSLVLRGLVTLSQRPELARKVQGILTYIVTTLKHDNEEIRTKALTVLRNVLPCMTQEKASLIALQLAEELPPIFDDESSQVRELSISLFKDAMEAVVWIDRKDMKKKVKRVLVPLFLRMSDQKERVAKASREALLAAAKLLGQRQLKYLIRTEQPCGECLLRHNKSRVEEYLHQSRPYLQDTQASVQEAAIRFIGLAAQHLRDRSEEKLAEIREALKPLLNDTKPSVCSLAAQTILILPSPREQRWTLRWLCC